MEDFTLVLAEVVRSFLNMVAVLVRVCLEMGQRLGAEISIL